VRYSEALASIRHRRDPQASGQIRATLTQIQATNHAAVGASTQSWLRELADFYLDGADEQPEWSANPAQLPDSTTTATLSPSELEWIKLQTSKDIAALDADVVERLAEFTARTIGTHDELYVSTVFDPIAEHWANKTERTNQRAATRHAPVDLADETIAELTATLARVLEQSPGLDEEIPDKYRNFTDHRNKIAQQVAKKRLVNAATHTPTIEPPAAPTPRSDSDRHARRSMEAGKERARQIHNKSLPLDSMKSQS